MTTLLKDPKDPADHVDYEVRWANWLAAGETLATVTWTVSDGITQGATDADTTTATIWLSGGSPGHSYVIACKVTTNQGREAERSFTVAVKDL